MDLDRKILTEIAASYNEDIKAENSIRDRLLEVLLALNPSIFLFGMFILWRTGLPLSIKLLGSLLLVLVIIINILAAISVKIYFKARVKKILGFRQMTLEVRDEQP